MDSDIEPARAVIRKKTDVVPEMVLVLGSGLGALAEAASVHASIATSALSGYPHGRVEGHRGQLVFGRLEGVEVMFVRGRLHCYEGHSARDTAFPVRLGHALGAERLIVTNAAGGISPFLAPGTLMVIASHINLTFESLLRGAQGEDKATTNINSYYDRSWRKEAREMARKLNVDLQSGTYAWTSGPSYETKAEIRAFRQLGGDAVGMSTVPEVLQARTLGMRVLGISTITNCAAGLSEGPLSHKEVLRGGERARDDLSRLVRGLMRKT